MKKKILTLTICLLALIIPSVSFASSEGDISKPFCITALENADISITIDTESDDLKEPEFQKSLDGTSWTPYTAGENISLSSGQNIYFKALSTNEALSSGGEGCQIASSGKFNLSGNILSLLYSEGYDTDEIIRTPLSKYAFRTLFSYSNVVDASGLMLPSTALSEDCYAFMFSHCTLLEHAPKLPATNLATGCYEFMFSYCNSLKEAPSLPAKQLEESCYFWMFAECTSLVKAPALPATELAYNCYQSLFMGCSNIESAVLPATILSGNCYRYIFRNCTNLKNVTLCFEADAVKDRSLEYWFEHVPAENLTITAPASLFESELLPKGCKYVELKDAIEVKVESHSLTLGGEIGINFIVSVPEGETAKKMTFKIKGDTSECSTKEAEGLPQGDGIYKYTCYINALQMADTIIASYEDGSFTEEYSVSKYIETFNDLYAQGKLTKEEMKAKDLIDALESYGYYNQIFLDSLHDNFSVGTDYAAMKMPTKNTFDNQGIEDYAIVKSELNEKIDKITTNLELESKTTLNVYVYTKDGYSLRKSDIKVINALTGEEIPYKAYVVTSGEKYKISFEGIPAHRLGEKYEITLMENTKVTVCALSYAYSKIAKGDIEANAVAFKAMSALYNYYKESVRYIELSKGDSETDEEV